MFANQRVPKIGVVAFQSSIESNCKAERSVEERMSNVNRFYLQVFQLIEIYHAVSLLNSDVIGDVMFFSFNILAQKGSKSIRHETTWRFQNISIYFYNGFHL